MTETPPQIPITPARRALIERLSIVWLIPLIALVIALAIAWQAYVDRGPLIHITFDNATGITADQTELKFRDIPVGLVEEVSFNDTLEHVVVSVRLTKNVAPFVDDDASFWIVRPEVTTRGISGLDTVLSGVFIEGAWNSVADGLETEFRGLDDAPLIPLGKTGTRILLRASGDKGLAGDTPIVYKGADVGRIGPTRIQSNGAAAVADAVVFAPYDRLITTSTRFWDSSGFTFTLGPGGAELDFSSLASLVSGGVTFETLVSGGDPIEDGAMFEVFAGEAAAKDSIFSPTAGETINLSVVFEQNVEGLTTGAPVQLGGLEIGEVTGLTGIVDQERFGDRRVRLLATLAIAPATLGLPSGADADEALDFLANRVQAGMRARLANASLLTGGLQIEFVVYENPLPGVLDRSTEPFPTFPSVRSEVSDLAATAEGVWKRINSLPIEELMGSAIRVMENAAALIDSDELRATPAEIRGLIGDVRGLVASEQVQALPAQLADVMDQVQSAANDLSTLLDTLQSADAANRLLTAVDVAAAAATAAETGITQMNADLPALTAQVQSLLTKVQDLPLDQFVTEATETFSSAEALLGAEATRTLPASANTTLAELRETLEALNQNGAAERLLAAVDATTAAAQGIDTATADLPQVLSQLDVLLAKAQALPLQDFVAEATKALSSADGILSTEATRALPAAVNDTLAELRVTLDELNEKGAADRLLAAVDAAAAAANNISTATEGLPDLIAQIQAVAAQADDLPLEAFVGELTDLIAAARTLIADDGTQALPTALSQALDQVSAVLAEFQDGGVITNTNQMLTSARSAADAIAQATQDLPQISARLNTVLAQATTTLATFDDKSLFSREVQVTLREIQEASDAVESLSRAIERQPNSLLLGR